MATSKSQRIGIWVIAVTLTIGTLGSFFVMILANDNAKNDQQIALQQQEEYNKLIKEYQDKLDKQNEELSKKYYPTLDKYRSEVGKFNADDVKSLKKQDLKVGDGATIKDDTKYSVYYIGWNPDGKIFDSSFDGKKLKSPYPMGPDAGVIQGWLEGFGGMKLGGVRLLTIPAEKAYAERGQGELIPPHTPLKFIVFAVPNPPEVPLPDFSSLAE